MWGGVFNGIIPHVTRMPPWWDDKRFRIRSAEQIVDGYLRAFDPDFVVVSPSAPKPSGLARFSEHRVLSLDDVFPETGEVRVGCGLDARAVYRYFEDRELRFVQRTTPEVVRAQMSNSTLSLLEAACFGRLPRNPGRDAFDRSFEKRLQPKKVALGPENFLQLLRARPLTPLRLATAGLRWQSPSWSPGPYLFLMRGDQPRDIIDYWNLRAFGDEVYPIPLEWANASLEHVNAMVLDTFRPGAQETNRRSVTLLRSRSVNSEEFQAFARRVASPDQHALSVQDWYPPLWEAWGPPPDMVERDERCEVTAESDDIERMVSNGLLTFDTLSPEFGDGALWGPNAKWINIVRLAGHSRADDGAPVLPPQLPDSASVFGRASVHGAWVGGEGLVVPCRYAAERQHWEPPTSDGVMRAWLSANGLAATPSDAGTTAREVLRALGGPWGAHSIANLEVVKLLNEMAHAEVQVVVQGEQPHSKRRARARAVERGVLLQRLRRANDGNAQRASRHLETLVTQGVLRVGLSVRCPKCSRNNFFPPNSIRDELTCDRCLRAFAFPASEVQETEWSYRTQGAFAVENYAQGGLSVAMCLRFLTTLSHDEATWTTGLQLKSASGDQFEVDLAVWLRTDGWSRRRPPSFILGECKSMGLFEAKDVTRARELARRLPGTTLVFATLREHLQPKERARLASLARWGRTILRGDEWIAPVVILTVRELTGRDGAPYCWKDLGEKSKRADALHSWLKGTRGLAAVTQELYLDLAYSDEARPRSRRRRRPG